MKEREEERVCEVISFSSHTYFMQACMHALTLSLSPSLSVCVYCSRP